MWLTSLLYCNHQEKCIKISTNMPSIGTVIRENGFEMLRIFREKKSNFVKTSSWKRLVLNENTMSVTERKLYKLIEIQTPLRKT